MDGGNRRRTTLISHRNQDYLDHSDMAGWEHPVLVSSDMADALSDGEMAAALEELRAARPEARTEAGDWADEDAWEFLGDGFHRVALRACGRELILVWNDFDQDFRVDFAAPPRRGAKK